MMNRTQELARQLQTHKHTKHSAREVLMGSLGSDPYRLLEDLRSVGKEVAKLEGVSYELQNSVKPLLATLATEYATTHAKQNLSEAKLDRLSKADPRYMERIKLVAQTIKEREEKKNEFWAIKSELDWDSKSVSHLNALTKLDG